MTSNNAALQAEGTQLPELIELRRVFQAQKQAFEKNSHPTADQRIEHLKKIDQALRLWQDKLAAAVSEDFGHRSADEFKMAELLYTLEGLKYCRKHVRSWMREEKRHLGLLLQPGKAKVVYQPLGVVGIIVPWNYPVFLSCGPLMYALAAGNRVMIKMSGFTPRMAEVFKEMIASIFAEDHVAVITGRGEVSQEFPKLPFDQITFTGSTNVGRIVMEEASKNLTPVLLELGGKSPVIVHESFPVKDTAERLAFGKCWNAGQTCVAPDHLYLPAGQTDAFVKEFRSVVSEMYPTMLNNPDFTSVVNEKQYRRLQNYLDDARAKGARIIEINPANESFADTRKMPITVVTGITPDMQLMQNEIFGPVLPVLEYSDLDKVLAGINAGQKPLALYYFDYNSKRADHVIYNTRSGGVTVNDVMMHVGADDLPFGGAGGSGMGRYHGREGFITMSNTKGVLVKTKLYLLRMLFPPFNKPIHGWVKKLFLSPK